MSAQFKFRYSVVFIWELELAKAGGLCEEPGLLTGLPRNGAAVELLGGSRVEGTTGAPMQLS